ncbi:SAM-dependent methyltransferase [Streptomyces abyssalis]|uniref:SAM-dependent methyltransferase n=1 Tax=Streptomyces abyssalis TaxID=933944 RepID=A0A1E7JSW2_9ACTN|nr:class I SAM-dependent methyltransferase [Streptomyces abyssalis]OEU91979.1 SAM-dependent methyltransferase [Streptomyces abyssalis]OEU93878.1 SAM-dependent methyltransferase [Streptomyces abyssalis]
MTDDTNTASPQEYWDGRYGESDRMWSGDANAVLVREVTGTQPGRALDLGCGEGADAIWLARRGWRVTAVDISRIALERASRHAADAEVASRIDWVEADLGTGFPSGSFELVSAHFLHSEVELPREQILRAAASAVAPGGVLLVVGHAGWPSWEHHPDHSVEFPTPDEVLQSLELAEGEWEVLLSGEHERTQTGPDGRDGVRTDNVLKLRRLAG